jgi:hypothetical protein
MINLQKYVLSFAPFDTKICCKKGWTATPTAETPAQPPGIESRLDSHELASEMVRQFGFHRKRPGPPPASAAERV